MSILIVVGDNKTGKTTLALSGPKPLRHYDLDLGYERASHRFNGQEIVSSRYAAPAQGIDILQGKVKLRPKKALHGVRELWEQWVEDYVTALQDEHWVSHAIDTGSQLWETCHRGFLQEKQEAQLERGLAAKETLRESLMPIEYGEPNARMRAMYYAARTYGRNLIITHYLKPEYQDVLTEKGKESMTTGKMIMDGYKHTDGLCDVEVWTYVSDESGNENAQGNVPWCRISLCGLDLRAQGMRIKEPTWGKIFEVIEKLRSL